MPDTRQALQKLLADGKARQVIEQLLLLTADERDLQNEVLQLSAQFAELERQSHLDVADPKLLETKRNRINAALLAVIDRLSENGNAQVKPLWKRLSWLGFILVLVGLLVYLNHLGMFSFKNPEPPTTISNPGPFPQ